MFKKGLHFYYRLLVTFTGVLALIATSFWLPWLVAPLSHLLAIIFFVAFLANFPLLLLLSEINLIPVVSLGSGMLYGPLPAAWGVLIGVIIGTIVRKFRQREKFHTILLRPSSWLEMGFTFGLNAIPLLLILTLLGWQQGFRSDPFPPEEIWRFGVIPAFLFALVYIFLFLGEFYLRRVGEYPHLFRELFTLGLVLLLPLPYVLIAVQAYPSIGIGSLFALGGILSVIGVLTHGTSSVRVALERRVQELFTLNLVSRTLRSTLDLDDLLPAIQEQVTDLLGVYSFYVALYEKDTNELWYPLAVKYGARQEWPRRQISDRLTDRVIRESKPILLNHQTQDDLSSVGLPPSEESPTSWLGVPLIASERTLGCLAVFEVSEDIVFTEADANLLTILSGQISVAIENALLYQQVQSRATQLETLYNLTSKIVATLDPQDVLKHVSESVAMVGGGQRSAVFLLEPGEDIVELAYAHGLSDGFNIRNTQFSIAHSRRTRCMRTGRPIYIADVQNSSLAQELTQLFFADKIRAFADFPLIAPEGQIGFLSVFFDTPHAFHVDEVELLQTFASQVAMAVSNARLYVRTDEALARRVHQLAIIEAVAREISAEIHSERLFSLILDYALEYTNSVSGSVDLYDPVKKSLEIKAWVGYDLDLMDSSVDEGIVGRVARTKEIANIGDVALDQDFVDLCAGNTHSQLSVPILHEQRVLGVITLESPEFNAYSESDQSFVVQLSSSASVALRNAELYSETQRMLREQSTLYQISNRMVGALGKEQVAQVLAQAMDAVLTTNATGIYLWVSEKLEYQLINDDVSHPVSHIPAKMQDSDLRPLNQQMLSGELVHFPAGSRIIPQLFGEADLCQIYIFPMVVARQRLGLVVLHLPAQTQLNDDLVQLLQAVVSQGAVALQSAHYYSDAMDGRERLSAVINSVGEGILMIGPDGHILLVNEPVRTFTGLALHKFENKKFQNLSDEVLRSFGYERAEISILLDDMGREQVLVSPKTTYKVPDLLPERFVERITSPVWGQGGRVIGWMIVLRDITEEYQINQARETITQTLVHDLRSPMSAVLGSLDMIDEVIPEESRDPVVDQSLQVATRSATRVLSLIESLLDISRLQSGRMQLDFERVDLYPLVEEVLVDFTILGNEFGIILHNEIDPEIPQVYIDRDKIVRVFANLLDNAIKFTPVGGFIKISAAPVEDRWVEVQVQDSGPGIPPEFQEKIFERFEQIPGQRGRKRGSGLGLTFCRLAVEAHGGHIWVNTPPEGGSIFTFLLPINRSN